MRIHTFGCSWTHGHGPVDEIALHSWARVLSERHPKVEVTNHALCGSSLDYSVAQLGEVLKNKEESIKIFQITAPFRYTVWSQDEIRKHRLRDQNYSFYTETAIQKTERYHGGWNSNRVREDKKFHKYLSVKRNHLAEKWNFLGIHDFLIKNCDFVFYHMRWDGISNPNLPCIKDTLGQQQFDKYIHDSGFHFGREGCEWVASWVEDNLKVKLP